jgi:DNA-binding CsgD family transcriptional regulator
MDVTGAPIWDFIDLCAKTTSLTELETAFMNEATRLGFEHVALISHVERIDLSQPDAVALLRYPQVWIDYYRSENLSAIDPVVTYADRYGRPFDWRDPHFQSSLSPPAAIMLAEARETGVVNGLTIPIRGSNHYPAACSFVHAPGDADPALLYQAHMAAHAAHNAALRLLLDPVQQERRPLLTKRERECLTLAARGKTDWAISEILGLSERTVHHAVERAKRRLGVASRVQAVVRALHLGEISFEEAIDWRKRR